jgi:O-antigen/teichoic acid export membrane protein
MASDREVGWYGAAMGLASLTLLLTPLINWVLIPLFSRAAATSEAELNFIVRRSTEFILALATPVSLLMVTGADVWISIVFGEAFAPAVTAMRVLSVSCLLMYVSIVAATALMMINRTWAMCGVFVSALVISPTLNLLLIGPGLGYGPGGGGAACAVASLVTEVCIVTMLFRLLGKRSADARLLRMVIKTLASAGIVIALDALALRPLGPVRLAIDAALYVALVLLTGAVDLKDTLGWARDAIRQRKAQAA